MAQSSGLKSLYIAGDIDDVNPPEHARRICQLFCGELMCHPGGHILPTDETSLRKYAEFLQIPV